MTSTDVGAAALGYISWDPYANVHGLFLLRDAAMAGDWPELHRQLRDCPSADALTYGLQVLAELPGIERLAESAVADHPDDVLARTLLAARWVRLGWLSRGDGPARTVGKERFEQFYDWLERAEQLLIDVCARRPDLAPAWTFRLTAARGLELGRAEARRRYARLAAHHPHHLPAQAQLLQYLCPKWGGTWEDALGFARAEAAAAPPGSPSGALVAVVHLERWAAEDGAVPPIRSAEVRDELCAAAVRSVWHPGAVLGVHEVAAHSAFALAFSLGGHAREAAPHFRVLGDRGDLDQWRLVQDPMGTFLRFRRAAIDATEAGGR